jgi:hypothetical protein
MIFYTVLGRKWLIPKNFSCQNFLAHSCRCYYVLYDFSLKTKKISSLLTLISAQMVMTFYPENLAKMQLIPYRQKIKKYIF